jgi:hypothetical protein
VDVLEHSNRGVHHVRRASGAVHISDWNGYHHGVVRREDRHNDCHSLLESIARLRMIRKALTVGVFALASALVGTVSLRAQGLHDKIAARKAEAERPKGVKDAVEIKVSKSYQETYDDVLNWIKRSDDFAADFANSNKDNGIVTSTIETIDTGALGWKKTGRRLTVELIKESDTETTLKVAVVNLQRIGADSWSNKPQDIKLNVAQTQAVVERMKASLLTK